MITEHSYVAVFVGGPLHGTVREEPGAPPALLRYPACRHPGPDWSLTAKDFRSMPVDTGWAAYVRRELADTPGRIAYTYDRNASI